MASRGNWPSDISIRHCQFDMETAQVVNSGTDSASEQAIDRLRDRWIASLLLPVRSKQRAQRVEAFLNSMRGQTNWVRLWHYARPAPLGTMRGTPTLDLAAAQGADQIRILTTPFATLKAGDFLGLDPLLVMVQDDAVATAGGILIATLTNRIRIAQLAGAAVVWDKPKAEFRFRSHSGVRYVPGYTEETSVELVERIA